MGTEALVPETWVATPPTQNDIILSSWLWGFTMSLAVFSGSKGFQQTYRSWRRSHKLNAYIVMVWLAWVTSIVVSICCWLYIMDRVSPRCVHARTCEVEVVADNRDAVYGTLLECVSHETL